MNNYRVFVRNWWKYNSKWPNGLEPDPTAIKRTITYTETETEARQICRKWNKEHEPGLLSRKAEYEDFKN